MRQKRDAGVSQIPAISLPKPVQQTVDYTGTLRILNESVEFLISLVRSIAGKEPSYTQNASITQNFYTPTADSYTVRNAASQAVSAAQARACRT